MESYRILPISLMVVVVAFAARCGGETQSGTKAPQFLALELQEVAVNETLTVPLLVDNPAGVPLIFSWSGPSLSGLDRCVQVVSSPSGGEFVYAPLSSHVGEHEFVLKMKSSMGTSQQVLRVKVLPAAGSAPVFLRPGAGGAFDLAQDPLVAVDVEVRDDDSTELTLGVAQGLPTGAEWIVTGPKSGHLEWRPTPDQVDASDRWPLVFEASDGQHDATTHSYLVILRRGAKEGCPGEAPAVAFKSPKKGEKVPNQAGYEVTFTASDDKGLRDAPVLYWTTEEQEDLQAPNFAEFQVVPAQEVNGAFVARVPSFGLAEGEERIVYAVISATDNDDPTGTACDHRTDSSVLRFIALGSSSSDQKASLCAACDFSSDCDSGVCAVSPYGGVCLTRCGGGECPGAVTCNASTSMEGGIQQTCGSWAALCPDLGGGTTGPCEPDPYEANNTWDKAAAAGKDGVQATICEGDSDFFTVDVAGDTQLAINLAPANSSTGDLDLRLLDSSGSIVAVSAHDGTEESIVLCAPQAATLIVEVFGYDGGTGAYSIELVTSSKTCCVDDVGEPDDNETQARLLEFPGLGEGSICPYNDDFFVFTVTSPQPVELVLAGGNADLDLIVYGPSGSIVAAGETPGDEEVTWNAVAGKHYLRVFGYMGDFGEYILEVTGSGSTQCTNDLGCPIGTVCKGGVCVDSYCSAASTCPSGYECPVVGPSGGLSMCGAPCTVNGNCRPEEGCKYFYEGRYCGLKGSGANGAPCQAFFECGGQRSCIPWPKGYCARDNCKSALDCEAGTFCVPIDGVGACVVSCWASESACRLADGYICDQLPDITGDYQLVCVPK